MKYENTKEGIFISRPNRFIAHVEIAGKEQICHVKNTGRCRELLIPGTRVLVEHTPIETRKTKYDLIAVYKGEKLINIDSQAPNKVVGEWIKESSYFGAPQLVKPEYTFGSSRFDFYIESGERKIFIEVKGVTLEENGVVLFPDAPTLRGVKHLKELAEATDVGYEAYVIFVIQMEDCLYFTPNDKTHPEFARTLFEVTKKGVQVIAMTCNVSKNELSLNSFINVKL